MTNSAQNQKCIVFAHSIRKADGRTSFRLMGALASDNDTQTVQQTLKPTALPGDSLERRPLYVQAPSPDRAVARVASQVLAGVLSPVEYGKLNAFVPVAP